MLGARATRPDREAPLTLVNPIDITMAQHIARDCRGHVSGGDALAGAWSEAEGSELP
jgi:hypothetical protein